MTRFSVGTISILGVAGGVVLALSACSSDAQMEPQEQGDAVVRALWSPSERVLPTPTDLARDTQTGRLALATDAQMSPAQREFNLYLNHLDGYPLGSTLKIPMSGEVFVPELGGAFFAFDAESHRRLDVAVSFDAETRMIEAAPTGGVEDGLQPGRRYVFGLRGYEGGLRGAAGEPVVADDLFYLLRSTSPIDAQLDAIPGESEEERLAAAQQLSALQQGFAPLIEQATRAAGFGRDELAVLAEFTTSDKSTVVFDPSSGEIPQPNQLLIDASTGLIDLPIAADDPAETRHIKEVLSAYDGFSISGALVLKSTHPVARDTVLNPASVRLFERREDGSFEEITDLERGVLDDEKTFWIRPRLTLKADTDYIYLTTGALKDTRGEPLSAQPVGAMLRSKAALTDAQSGASQLSVIDDATAQTLEPVRQRSEALLDMLQGESVMRQEMGAAVPFHTQSAAELLMARRAELYTRDVSTELMNVEVASPLARGLWLSMPLVRTIVSGELYTLDGLDPRTRRAYADGRAEERRTSFVLTIPTGVEKGEPIPVVLFGHGLMTSRELTYLIANKLAGAGYAVFSLDLPYHGDRAVCLADTDCRGNASCDEVGQCKKADGSEGEVARIRAPFVDAEFPISTGFAFIEVDNLVGTRDHFGQALLDLMQGYRVIKHADWAASAEGYTLAGDDVVYLGMSLGGILGANMAALEPGIQDFVLNVPGAGFLSLIENSDAFVSIFNNALVERGAPRGSDAYFRFSNIMRWLLDPVDPLNIAHHATQEPLRYVDPQDGQTKTMPPKRVLIQMAKNDGVVPNISTQILAERMGLAISTYDPSVSNHGFFFDPTSLSGYAARQEMVDFFDARE
ncbi:alpha/beta hydrolase [Bradymonas sediminis]|uniref:Uncharacterized protein n=1 Tax=Bradymonas sediminis TaxID=1548548 RepID=A0A2Z4FQG4_9DELT|nr:alpha/beta hydrolase [Bradymonas sediminis]AWV90898.1 hypothetical protein DN745_16835 [Bradymonas sediminis]TDP75366.1 virulence factor lipase-like protein [Bradymonas sediminis]